MRLSCPVEERFSVKNPHSTMEGHFFTDRMSESRWFYDRESMYSMCIYYVKGIAQSGRTLGALGVDGLQTERFNTYSSEEYTPRDAYAYIYIHSPRNGPTTRQPGNGLVLLLRNVSPISSSFFQETKRICMGGNAHSIPGWHVLHSSIPARIL